MLSRMPVLDRLVTNIHAFSDDITLIDRGSPRDYAQRIMDILDRVKGGDDIGKRLQSLSRANFSWEGELAKLSRFYLRILGC